MHCSEYYESTNYDTSVGRQSFYENQALEHERIGYYYITMHKCIKVEKSLKYRQRKSNVKIERGKRDYKNAYFDDDDVDKWWWWWWMM